MLYFNTNKPHSFFFGGQNTSRIRKPQVISGGGGRTPCPPPLDPPLSRAKATNRKLLRPSTKTKRMPFFNFEFGDPNPVALQRTVWRFLYKTSVSEQENISLPLLQFLQVQQGRIQDFFRRGCTRLLRYFNTNKPHSFSFFAEYQLY